VFGPPHYFISGMAQIKEKLFGAGEKGDDGPSEKDDQEKYELFDQVGIHKPSSFSQWPKIICIFPEK
jgi:hypothetical protein